MVRVYAHRSREAAEKNSKSNIVRLSSDGLAAESVVARLNLPVNGESKLHYQNDNLEKLVNS